MMQTLTDTLEKLGFTMSLPAMGPGAYLRPPVVAIPAGDFLMGTDLALERDADAEEAPQQRVTLAAYQMAQYPVTVAEYAAFLQATATVAPPYWDDQATRPDHPVVEVSWADANAFASWLTAVSGVSWRLPTEAEWEKAARGTDGRIYPWGMGGDDEADTDDERLRQMETFIQGGRHTFAIGCQRDNASPYGVQDLVGNIAQWTATAFRSYPYLAHDGREDLTTPGPRVARGESWWYGDADFARVARRSPRPATEKHRDLGFRLLLADPITK